MPTPFPGMDPYLEQPALWPNVHNSLIVAIRDVLSPQLRPRYYVSVEERTYRQEPGGLTFAGRPDAAIIRPAPTSLNEPTLIYEVHPAPVLVELPLPDEMTETYLEVRSVEDDRVITVLEILSPSNKRYGTGRELYLSKRSGVLASLTHLVEIDLLRGGEPMPMRGKEEEIDNDYRILISRRSRRPTADLYPFSVREPIPPFELPLQKGDDEPLLDLNRLLHELYDRAGYDLRIDYQDEANPPLRETDAVWSDALLKEAGLLT